MVVNCRRKDIAIVLEYLNTNNAPPSILQANTSKKVSNDCSFAHRRIFVKEIATLVLFYCLKKIICRLIPSEQLF